MAQFTIDIDDSLIPGIVAIAYTEGKQPEDIIQEYAYSAANKACQDYQVGPYWVMPEPRFNQDGTPYVAPIVEDEPALETNDTNPPVVEEEV
jgi:hypothetical protein